MTKTIFPVVLVQCWVDYVAVLMNSLNVCTIVKCMYCSYYRNYIRSYVEISQNTYVWKLRIRMPSGLGDSFCGQASKLKNLTYVASYVATYNRFKLNIVA